MDREEAIKIILKEGHIYDMSNFYLDVQYRVFGKYLTNDPEDTPVNYNGVLYHFYFAKTSLYGRDLYMNRLNEKILLWKYSLK